MIKGQLEGQTPKSAIPLMAMSSYYSSNKVIIAQPRQLTGDDTNLPNIFIKWKNRRMSEAQMKQL